MSAPAPALAYNWADVPEAAGRRWVFVDGRFDADASSVADLAPGVVFAPALECALIRVRRGVVLTEPLHVVFVSSGQSVSFPLLRLVAEPGSALTLIESHLGKGAGATDAVTTVRVEAGADVKHVRMLLAGASARHGGRVEAELADEGRYALHAVTLGGGESRLEVAVTLEGELAEAHLDGLTHVFGSERAETRSEIIHQAPRGRSRQLHHVLAGDRAQATFHGRIRVERGAQLTDAAQSSRSLMLSETARIDAQPELMIFADDVKCAHGAAIGQIDPDAVFYLQSRGLAEPEARGLLTAAFAAEAIARLPVPSLRVAVADALKRRVNRKDPP